VKILVTVGTTAFDRLIQMADAELSGQFELTSQISDGKFKPKNHPFFQFSSRIDDYIENSDLVISHGGAGTIYRALELGKKLVIVPNLDRVDHHQLDICDYMVENHHAVACLALEKLLSCVQEAINTAFDRYIPEPFVGIGNIRTFLELQ